MSEQTRKQLAEEAIRALKSYLLSGIDGFRVKGVDRARAIGINIDRFEDSIDGVEHLIGHLFVRF